MLFQIRRKDGSIDPFSAGTFVDAQGRAMHLRASDFQLSPTPYASAAETWTSPSTHARYPVRWQIHVAGLNLTLLVTTPLPSQELATRSSFIPSYWEGAILLQGKKNSSDIAGAGYLEMTGYDRPVSMQAK
jgi:predicted secreted hydrolase